MTWTQIQVSASEAHTAGGTTVTPTLPGGSTAGNLLVCVLTNSGSGTWTLPAGWVQCKDSLGNIARAINSGNSAAEMWCNINNAGGISSVLCTSSASADLRAGLIELHTDVASPTVTVNAVGTGIAGAVMSDPVSTNTVAAAGDAAVCVYHESLTAAGVVAWTNPSGFTLLVDDTASASHHLYSAYNLSVSAGTLTVTGKTGTNGTTHGWGGVVVTFTATSGTAGTAGHVGEFVNPVTVFGAGTTVQQGYADWSNIMARANTCIHVYFGTIPAAITADLQAWANAGIKVLINLKPAINPPTNADAAALQTFLQSCTNAGLNAVVSLWAEPINNMRQQGITPSASLFIAMMQFYYSTVHQFYPVAFNVASFTVQNNNELSYYPGDAFCDVVALDYYCKGWINDGSPTYPSKGSALDKTAAVADGASPPKPLGLYEYCSSTDPVVGQTQTQATGFWTYLQAFFTARLNAGKTNGDILIFNSQNANTNLNTAINSASDYRIALQQSMFDALDSVNTTAGTLTGETDIVITSAGVLSTTASLAGASTITITSSGVLGSPGQQPFPVGPLLMTVELLLGGVWTDVTAYVYDQVSIIRGHPDESTVTNPSVCTLVLDNSDGRFSPRNPNGPYYGNLTRNTQVRVSVIVAGSRSYRFWGEVPAWPATWEVTGAGARVPVQAAGILRRLSQGSPPPLHSALYRYYTLLTGASVPVAYWPLEDAAGSTSFSSPIAGVSPAGWTGSPALAAGSFFACSAPLPQNNSATITAAVPGYAATTAWTVRFLVNVDPSLYTAGPQPVDLADIYTTSTFGVISIFFDGSQFIPLFSSGITGGAGGSGAPGTAIMVSVEMTTNGGNITLAVRAVQPGGVASSGSITVAGTAGVVNQVTLVGLGATVYGHLALQTALTPLPAQPLNAWRAETAGNRFSRLCSEQGVPFLGTGELGKTVLVGAQTIQSFTALLQECADADRGMMLEPRTQFGLGYRTRYALSNQNPAVTLDYTAEQVSPPLGVTDDDQYTVNDITVTRGTATGASGSSARQVDVTSPLSTQAPPAGVGPYPTAVTLNVAYDVQAADEAGWLLHMGTVNEQRYPQVTADLAKTQPSLPLSVLKAAAAADLGDYLKFTGAGTLLPPGPVRQIIQGVTETLSLHGWTIQWQGVPESPYETLTVDPGTGSSPERPDTDGSQLHANISSGATSMSVDITGPSGVLWTTTDVPFDVIMGGEQITVGAISGAATPQTFSSLTRSVNGVVKAHTAGENIVLALPPILAM